MECFDFKISISSPPKQTASCDNNIGQMEAVAQFSNSHRYKKGVKFAVGFLSHLNPPNSPFTLGYQKQSFFSFLLNLILTKTEKEFLEGALVFHKAKGVD